MSGKGKVTYLAEVKQDAFLWKAKGCLQNVLDELAQDDSLDANKAIVILLDKDDDIHIYSAGLTVPEMGWVITRLLSRMARDNE